MKKLITLLLSLQILLFTATTSFAQNVYRLNNKFENKKIDLLYKQNDDGTIDKKPKKIANSLKGYIVKQSEDKDTLYIKFWNINPSSDPHNDDSNIINAKNDNDKTFAYKIKWKDDRYFEVPFSATTITAVNIPFRYRLKSASDLEANFLNAGANLFFVRGTTKFFKQGQIEPRQNYWGLGPFLGFSQQKIDSSNTGGKATTEKQVAALSYGVSGVRCWNGFSILVAIGFDNTIGSNAKHWEENNFKHGLKPWVGFGFGFKLTDIELKITNDSNK